MAIKTRNELKQYFRTGYYPTENQFADLIDSMLVSGQIAVSDIAGLVELLQGKASNASLQAFEQGEKRAYDTSGTYEILANYLLEKMIVLPGADALVRVGSSIGSDDIMPEVPVSEATGQVLVVNLYAKTNRTIFISGLPAGSHIIFLKRLIKILV